METHQLILSGVGFFFVSAAAATCRQRLNHIFGSELAADWRSSSRSIGSSVLFCNNSVSGRRPLRRRHRSLGSGSDCHDVSLKTLSEPFFFSSFARWTSGFITAVLKVGISSGQAPLTLKGWGRGSGFYKKAHLRSSTQHKHFVSASLRPNCSAGCRLVRPAWIVEKTGLKNGFEKRQISQNFFNGIVTLLDFFFSQWWTADDLDSQAPLPPGCLFGACGPSLQPHWPPRCSSQQQVGSCRAAAPPNSPGFFLYYLLF